VGYGILFFGGVQNAVPILKIVRWGLSGEGTIGQSIVSGLAGAMHAQVSALHHDDEAVVLKLMQPFANRFLGCAELFCPITRRHEHGVLGLGVVVGLQV
jgi:hypothetical protein